MCTYGQRDCKKQFWLILATHLGALLERDRLRPRVLRAQQLSRGAVADQQQLALQGGVVDLAVWSAGVCVAGVWRWGSRHVLESTRVRVLLCSLPGTCTAQAWMHARYARYRPASCIIPVYPCIQEQQHRSPRRLHTHWLMSGRQGLYLPASPAVVL